MEANVNEPFYTDIDIKSLIQTLALNTTSGSRILHNRLRNPTTDKSALISQQETLKSIRQRVSNSPELFADNLRILSDTEKLIQPLDTGTQELYSEFFWKPTSFLSQLNTIGLVTEGMTFIRTMLIPLFVVIAPLLSISMIFIMMWFRNGEFPTVTSVFSLLSQSMPSILGKKRFTGKGGILEHGEQMAHIGAGIGLFIANIWSQASSVLHLKRTVSGMRIRADAMRRMLDSLSIIENALDMSTKHDIVTLTGLPLLGYMWNDPARVDNILERVGTIDMLITVATRNRICWVNYTDTIQLTDFYHPELSITGKCIYNSLHNVKNHILLTGPNRGGKSTVLKAIGINVLLSQTFGIAFARAASLPLFTSIKSALSPIEVLGSTSLFESEIDFAKSVLDNSGGKMFIMMDEIFHGTNAHDGVEASQIFLDSLYANTSVCSIVSTHYMDLPKRYENISSNMCMEAYLITDEHSEFIKYTYKLHPGVNNLSSVREILRERGLMR